MLKRCLLALAAVILFIVPVAAFQFVLPELDGPIKPISLPLYVKYAEEYSKLQQNLASREVITPYSAEPRQIALTFDDGPSPRSTAKILEILRRYNVHATFFVVGIHAQLDRDLLRQISADGNEIGNHTYHHYDLSQLNERGVERELNDGNSIIASIIGARTYLFRPPGGQYNKMVLDVAKRNHYGMVLWDINPADYFNIDNPMPTEPDILNDILSKLGGNRRARMILLHENMNNTVDALPAIIEYGLYHGYTFVTVSTMKYKPRFRTLTKP